MDDSELRGYLAKRGAVIERIADVGLPRAGNAYVIEGSGNHANNSRVEQYVIDNDEAVYQFVIGWIAEIRAFVEA